MQEKITISGEQYSYQEFDYIQEDTTVLAQILRTQANLLDRGVSDGLTFSADAPVNVLYHKDLVVGFMIYEDTGSIERTITLAWVHPAHRQKGLHSFLFRKLKDQATEHGFFRILRGHHKENYASALAQMSQGSQIYATNGDYVYTRNDLR